MVKVSDGARFIVCLALQRHALRAKSDEARNEVLDVLRMFEGTDKVVSVEDAGRPFPSCPTDDADCTTGPVCCKAPGEVAMFWHGVVDRLRETGLRQAAAFTMREARLRELLRRALHDRRELKLMLRTFSRGPEPGAQLETWWDRGEFRWRWKR